MEIIRETIAETPYGSKAFTRYFGSDWAVLDIETTGLSPRTSKVILAGLCFPCGDHLEAVQLFAHSRGEEEELLEALDRILCGLQSINPCDPESCCRPRTVITYNGNQFDLPYLRERYKANRLIPHWLPVGSLDLYRCARYYSPLKQILPNLKQKSVEVYMGLSTDRTDEIGGEESVQLYLDYETFGNPEERQTILLHNRDDIVQLSRLLSLLDKLDLHRIVFGEGLAVASEKESSAAEQGSPLAVIKTVAPGKTDWHVEGALRSVQTDYFAFEDGYSAALYANKERKNYPGTHKNDRAGTFALDIPVQMREGCWYLSLADFPEEIAADPALQTSPRRVDDFLILGTAEAPHYYEINVLIQRVLQHIL